MSEITWHDVTASLLARWPAQRWDRDQAEAYVNELRSDGLSALDAMTGLRASTGAFVPSVGEVTAKARQVANASMPTFDELMILLEKVNYTPAPRGVYRDEIEQRDAQDHARNQLLAGTHPVAASFIARHGGRFHGQAMTGDDGTWARKDLAIVWAEHQSTWTGREIAVLASGRGRGELARLDPLAALEQMVRPALPSGEAA